MKMYNINTRLHNLDLLKTLSIYFVILYHCLTISGDIRTGNFSSMFNYAIVAFLSLCLPLFIIVNGGLLFNKVFNFRKHINKTFRIIILVIIWDIASVTIKGVFLYNEPSVSSLLRHMWRFDSGWSNQLWFLMALFVLYLFFPLFKTTYDQNKRCFLYFNIVVLIVVCGNNLLLILARFSEFLFHIGYTDSDFNFLNQFNPLRGLYGFTFLYFLSGAFLILYSSALAEKLKLIPAIAILLICIAFLTVYGVICTVSSQSYFDIGWESLDTFALFIASICAYRISLLYRYKDSNLICRFIRKVSENTLGIYLLQSILSDFLRTVLSETVLSSHILLNLISSFLLLCLCTLICTAARRIPLLCKCFLL